MSDNALILGAGFSHDANVPLLSGFVEQMSAHAIRKKANDQPLSKANQDTFERAMRIRFELDGYHGRAMFDDRNIEDILSLLSFNALAEDDRANLSAMTKAIARTIELSCNVKHLGVRPAVCRDIREGPEV